MADFEEIAAGLRAWAEGDQVNTAAVELIIWHETWIRRRDFLAAAADVYEADEDGPAMSRIRWDDARAFADGTPRCSTSELGILRLAIAIGAGDFALSGFGRVHRRKAAEAFAAACGWRLEGDIPEAGHSHPDFIPGTPETCARCAIDAGDEGHA